MNGKFQLYVAFVDGIPIGIGTLTKISQFCNVKRRTNSGKERKRKARWKVLYFKMWRERMFEVIQAAGPFVLAFWFGTAFGFCVCALFAGRKR